MKVRKSDMPRKNFTCENIMYSLSKAINNQREGNYLDCGFEKESDFIDYLNALERANIICKKSRVKKEVNLSNYIFVINDLVTFNKKNSFLKWLSDNVISLLSITIGAVELYNK